METNRGAPTPPIAFGGPTPGVGSHLDAGVVEVDDAVFARLGDVCASVTRDAATLDEASRDWWPLAMIWALDNEVAARAVVVARPSSADEVAAVLRVCDDTRIPVTAAAGRSGVCGASVPLHGGVVLDCCGLAGIVDVDRDSMVLDVRSGTFGDVLEDELRREHGVTVGHWPQSVELSTVGGWLACRGAGQYSTRYGKIEDIVIGLDVVLADGRRLSTGGAPRAAVGPDLTQLFVGSEGTLGPPPKRAPRSRSTPSRRDSTPAAGSCTGARRRRSCVCTTTSRVSAASPPAQECTRSSCSTRVTHRSSARPWPWCGTSVRTPPSSTAPTCWAAGSSIATT